MDLDMQQNQQSTQTHKPIAFTTLKSHEAFETTHLRSN